MFYIKHFQCGDGRIGFHQLIQITADRGHFPALTRYCQQHAVCGIQKLAVEQIGSHRIFNGYLLRRDTHGFQLGTGQALLNVCQHPGFIEKGLIVIEQAIAITDRNHIVVEHTGIDSRWILLGKHGMAIGQAMQAGNGA